MPCIPKCQYNQLVPAPKLNKFCKCWCASPSARVFATARARLGGYLCARLHQLMPPGPLPRRTMCGRCVALQMPPRPVQRLLSECSGRQPQKAMRVLLRQRDPNWHISKRAQRHPRRSSAATGGASQKRDVSGFSTAHGTPCLMHSLTSLQVALMVALPTTSLEKSLSDRPLMPKISATVRRGPPGLPALPNLALVHVVHGVPMAMPPTMPEEIHPTMSSRTGREVRSTLRPVSRSSEMAGRPSRFQALQTSPMPPNKSRKTFWPRPAARTACKAAFSDCTAFCAPVAGEAAAGRAEEPRGLTRRRPHTAGCREAIWRVAS